MEGGWARLKIKSETFNALKNQCYQIECNFSHGNLQTAWEDLGYH
jgi:hypothetical protein